MKFLIDNQLPPAPARFLQTEFNLNARHVVDVGLQDASDAEIWAFISKDDSILISKDEDFANMILQEPTARLIWVRIGNCRKAFLLDVFRRIWPRIRERIESGDGLVEIR